MIAVLDTNILLTNPDLSSYAGNTVYIPIAVYKELDRQKGLEGMVGFKARAVNRRIKNSIEHEEYYDYNGLGLIKIIKPNPAIEGRINKFVAEEKADDAFLNMNIFQEDEYVLHTGDFSLYQLMHIHGKNAFFVRDLNKDFLENIYSGYRIVEGELPEIDQDINENEYFLVKGCSANRIHRVKNGEFKPVKPRKVYGIESKNLEQTMLIDALTDRDVKVIILTGGAGTGKTILSLAAGLQLQEDGEYDSIILSKSLAPLTKEDQVGFLPGELAEKLIPQFRNFTSNLEVLCGGKHKFKKDGKLVVANEGSQILEHKMMRGEMEIMALDSVLGASFSRKFVIIDEAQSLNADALKCVLSRISDNSKLILLGDVMQKTAAMHSPDRSALFIANKYLKDMPDVAVLSLSKVERGKTCERIQQRLLEAEI